jgi:cyclohexa-1,5-dienecarbonyl-CoA hydratase
LTVPTVRTAQPTSLPGRVRLILDAPHGNAITDTMVGALRDSLQAIARRQPFEGRAVKLVTIEAAGSDFSFGASLEEHTPDRMPEILPRFHSLIVELLRVPAVTAAVLSGRCLGGGFELALACDVIFASNDAVMGLPEIAVGAFPPVGSILLPLKVRAARASAAILTGQPRPAAEWQAFGLVERVAPRDQLAAAVEAWYASAVEPHSAAALQRAALASRLVVLRSVDALLPQAERLYLDDLLATADAAEGIAAFLEKRSPQWKDS